MSDETLDDATKSRRRILQAAAAAGVGAAVLGAPKVSVIPAYGLTNSQVTNKCFYFAWQEGNGGGSNDFWSTTATNADSTSGSGKNVTYTWNNLTTANEFLVIIVSGSPSAGTASFSTTAPAGCSLTVMAGTSGNPYDAAPSGCSTVGNSLTGTYSASNASGISSNGVYYLAFDLSC